MKISPSWFVSINSFNHWLGGEYLFCITAKICLCFCRALKITFSHLDLVSPIGFSITKCLSNSNPSKAILECEPFGVHIQTT